MGGGTADWNNDRRDPAFTGLYGAKATRTVFAGFILLAFSNALLILSLGTEPSVPHTTNAPGTTGPAGVQSTRTLGASTAPLSSQTGGQTQTVV